MKKFLAAFIMVLLMATSVFQLSLAEDLSNLESWSDEDIWAAREILNEELVKRGSEVDSEFYPGVYVGGKSIKSGSYRIEFVEVATGLTIDLFASEEDFEKEKWTARDVLYKGIEGYSFTINDGEVIRIKPAGSVKLKIKNTKASWIP